MYILIIFIFFAVVAYLFFQLYPPFGGKTKKAVKQRSPNFVNGKFVNQIPTSMKMKFTDGVALLGKQLNPTPGRKPPRRLVPVPLDVTKKFTAKQSRITWFGHSAFLLQMHGKNILLDPMFGKAASPIQAVGPQRFSDELPVRPEDLPHIDLVVISHDHFDHLDYGSIKKLANKTTMFFVPIGLAAHLKKWGVAPTNITELDWWEERTFEGLTLTCTPSRHFSGRTLTDRFATLWCSWVIRTDAMSIFFSGDTGYGPHFKQIAKKYGPFDLALLECGQYDPLWSTIHMTPEQTIEAYGDLGAKRMVPMHWGAFALALHAWTDPIDRVLTAGKKVGAVIMTPQIGETFDFTEKNYPTEHWWENYNS